jgi:hypothetical protein
LVNSKPNSIVFKLDRDGVGLEASQMERGVGRTSTLYDL